MTVLVFPDVEGICAAFLRTQLATRTGYTDVAVHVREPDTLPARFVKVRRVGGSRDSIVTDAPRIQYTAWGSDDVDAQALAQLVRGLLLRALPGTVQQGHPVYHVDDFGGPVPAPDPDTDRPRYFGTVDIRLRGSEQ